MSETRVVTSKFPNDTAQVHLSLAYKCMRAAETANTMRQPREPNSTVSGVDGTYNPNNMDDTHAAMLNIDR